MAKKSKRGGAKERIIEGAPNYFYLVKLTDKGRIAENDVIREEQEMVTRLVQSFGGKCELYLVHNSYDFISRVTGVEPAEALTLAKAIEEGGNVTATYTSGFQIFK